jgi:hypothetical protein
MSITINLLKKGKVKSSFTGDKKRHAEEVLFAKLKDDVGDLNLEMNAWPCISQGRHHDCHGLFQRKSKGRTIILTITGDSGGYSADHNMLIGATGKITYTDSNIPVYS